MHDPADPLQSQHFRGFATVMKLVLEKCYATGPLTVGDGTFIDSRAVLLKNVRIAQKHIHGDK